MKNKIQIKVIKYYKEDGITLSKSTNKYITTNGYKVYENLFYKYASLKKRYILLFHYLCEKMDESNNIVHTANIRNGFIKYCENNTSKLYSHDTIKQGFSALKSVGLLINYNVKRDFTVNPRHVFKGSEKKRREVINEIIHSLSGKETISNYEEALGLNAPVTENS